ncbi:Glycosyltransferase involved in cell wall bisynthesis [Mariniphaga anaerophila]|uniref:Glycosyltransferase involved in cell wall bisynthesis n=1 Tax=Mariniphaga anaerophila TaxID=1484053 RepID=A0A1M5BM98_9BACT|nr:glycosyltransferase family 4 protein [Mariniphaga anaerophila]SHF43526.1 Glycosyltransferase involved in cell wall bisynthesis [Mariniphaga anaerophila]
MNVLWITNSPFSEAYKGTRLEENAKGWVNSAAYGLIEYKNISLGVVSLYPQKEFNVVEANRIRHYLLPKKQRNNKSSLKKYWTEIANDFKPDIIHIHGTEYPFLSAFVELSDLKKIVVSIQGLVSVIERYYLGGIKKSELMKSTSLRDIIRVNTIFSQHLDLQKRGNSEKSLLKKVNHVIGRTTWDYCHVKSINPKLSYHFCNEILRPIFYEKQWDISACEKYSIFISQAYYPLKGFHQLLKALPQIIKIFPDTKVYVAGNDFVRNRGFRINGYGRFIKKFIEKNNLKRQIIFTGLLSNDAIQQRFLNSHVFVNPSSIENSSNSIGEAQILGVPCVASYVGGTPDLIKHRETGLLYRFEEVEMLAENVCKIFSDEKLASRLSQKSRIVAQERHNKEINTKRLLSIYQNIIEN